MSEYQYYEFRAVDRPLTQAQMQELRRLSTRAEITPTSLTNVYHWGDFKGDPNVLMEKYFDAHVYIANRGHYRLMLAIPEDAIDLEAAEAYCDERLLSIRVKGGRAILDFDLREEDGWSEWEEGEGRMPTLIGLRAELISGDLRPLYLGWLAGLSQIDAVEEVEDETETEPPVPPGLKSLTAPQRALVDLLDVSEDLLEVAVEASVGDTPAGPSREDLARWVGKLPSAQKDDYLVRLLAEEADMAVRMVLARRFREAMAPKKSVKRGARVGRRVADLLAARDARAESRRRSEEKRKASERARREREEAKARDERIARLAADPEVAWGEVETLVASKKPDAYDRAVAMLADLRELARRACDVGSAETRIRDLRDRHRSKSAFLRRLR
jgi:hypothetical protein